MGGTTAADRNVIVGGVTISYAAATGNTIQGNYIGTNGAGTANVSSRLGVWISGGSNNTIGGTAVGAGNVISGSSSGNGVEINNGGTGIALGNVVQGNLIGTNAAGERGDRQPRGGCGAVRRQQHGRRHGARRGQCHRGQRW